MTATYRNHRCAVCRAVIQKHLRLCANCEAALSDLPPVTLDQIETPLDTMLNANGFGPRQSVIDTALVSEPSVVVSEPQLRDDLVMVAAVPYVTVAELAAASSLPLPLDPKPAEPAPAEPPTEPTPPAEEPAHG